MTAYFWTPNLFKNGSLVKWLLTSNGIMGHWKGQTDSNQASTPICPRKAQRGNDLLHELYNMQISNKGREDNVEWKRKGKQEFSLWTDKTHGCSCCVYQSVCMFLNSHSCFTVTRTLAFSRWLCQMCLYFVSKHACCFGAYSQTLFESTSLRLTL